MGRLLLAWASSFCLFCNIGPKISFMALIREITLIALKKLFFRVEIKSNNVIFFERILLWVLATVREEAGGCQCGKKCKKIKEKKAN